MTSIIGGISWYFTNLPIGLKILGCIGIFLILYVITLNIISYLRKQTIPNKLDLLNAIAKYETSSRDYFWNLDQTTEQQQVEAGRHLQEQLLISRLSGKRGNPIPILVNFVGIQLMLKLGSKTNRPDMLLDKYSFVGGLRIKTERAITWVDAVSR